MSAKLTDAQLVMMSAAAQRKDRCLSAPATIKGAALTKVSAKLAKLGLAREIEAKPGAPTWCRDEAGQGYALKLTAAGLKAIAVDEVARGDRTRRGAAAADEEARQAGRSWPTGPGGHPARRQRVGAGDRTSAASRRRDHRRFDSSYGMAAAHDAGALTGLRQRGYPVIRERIGAGDSVYRISDVAGCGECPVIQGDAAADHNGEPTPKVGQAA